MAGEACEGAGVGEHTNTAGYKTRIHKKVKLLVYAADMVKKPPGGAVLHLCSFGAEVHCHCGQHSAVGGVKIIENGFGKSVFCFELSEKCGKEEGVCGGAHTVAAGVRSEVFHKNG